MENCQLVLRDHIESTSCLVKEYRPANIVESWWGSDMKCSTSQILLQLKSCNNIVHSFSYSIFFSKMSFLLLKILMMYIYFSFNNKIFIKYTIYFNLKLGTLDQYPTSIPWYDNLWWERISLMSHICTITW